MSKKVYEVVTQKIIRLIEESDELIWRKPWKNVLGSEPINYTTKKMYKGYNYVALTTIANAYGNPNIWITFNQAKKAGLTVKKGAESIPLIFWNFKKTEKEVTEIDDNGNEVKAVKEIKYPFCRYFRVFNITDTDAVIEEEKEEESTLDYGVASEETIERYVEKEKLSFISRKSNRAFYSPLKDEVVVPEITQYEKKSEYYSTTFHELIHSTGHESRLNRIKIGETLFGNKVYSKEELVAEIGASILCNLHGFENTMENNVAYIKSWLKKIKDEPHILISACTRAYKAVDMIKG